VGSGHLLRCFWYQLAEMYGLAQLGNALETTAIISPPCLINDEFALLLFHN